MTNETGKVIWLYESDHAPVCPRCKEPLESPWYELCQEAGTHDNEIAQYECTCGAHVEFKVHIVPMFCTRIVKEPPDRGCPVCGGSGGGPDPETKCPACRGRGE